MARQEKAPAATEALKHTSDQTNAPRHSITPRQRRALQALLRGPQTTSKLRNAIGCVNTADVIMRFRRRGLSIPCTSVRVLDRDGKTCTVGSYSLTASDAQKVRKWLGA